MSWLMYQVLWSEVFIRYTKSTVGIEPTLDWFSEKNASSLRTTSQAFDCFNVKQIGYYIWLYKVKYCRKIIMKLCAKNFSQVGSLELHYSKLNNEYNTGLQRYSILSIKNKTSKLRLVCYRKKFLSRNWNFISKNCWRSWFYWRKSEEFYI